MTDKEKPDFSIMICVDIKDFYIQDVSLIGRQASKYDIIELLQKAGGWLLSKQQIKAHPDVKQKQPPKES